ncbi:MAG: RNA 2',3'-cyclic phosphodiesterase [Elusimicrobiales bacterium]|jgi:2'-5' RNA ligase|nr:RNA 2',3'-cyclic phosphodiesterase [Elusimicrobiales bacterium]
MRVFAAAAMELPPGLPEALARSARLELGPAARPVGPGGMHLTLAFLGEVPPGRVGAAGACLDALSGSGTFTAVPGEAGFFPSPEKPRVFWLGFGAGAERLAEAAARLSAALRGEGFVLEERPFVPHLTLARLKGSVPAAAAGKAAAAAVSLCRGMSFPVSGAVLFSSALSPDGPRYSQLKRVEF